MDNVVRDNGSMDVVFDPQDGSGPYSVNKVYDEGEAISLASYEDEEDCLNLGQHLCELNALPSKTAGVYFKAFDEDYDFEVYKLTDHWEKKEDCCVIYLEDSQEEEEDGFVDLTECGRVETVTVKALRSVLSSYELEGNILLDDGGQRKNCTVDALYRRDDYVVLQSNPIERLVDEDRWPARIPEVQYIRHCLKWSRFCDSDPVYAMVCDEDFKADIYKIKAFSMDRYDQLILRIESFD
jgi:hypothetical protein